MDRGRIFLPLALAALVLASCAAPAAPQEPDPLPEAPEETVLPETHHLGSFTAPTVVTQGQAPAQAYDLPTGREYPANLMDLVFGAEATALLAELPEAEAAYYGCGLDTALLRWGDSLASFSWPLEEPWYLPELYCFDFDGDGAEELVVLCYSGPGGSVCDLHVVEKNGDGTLTDYALPRELFTRLSAAVTVCPVGGRTYAVLGTELVDLTRFLTDGDMDITKLVLGDTVHYDVNPGTAPCGQVLLRAGARAEGSGLPPSTIHAADVEATVSFNSWGAFTLDLIHLNGND